MQKLLATQISCNDYTIGGQKEIIWNCMDEKAYPVIFQEKHNPVFLAKDMIFPGSTQKVVEWG